jgi:two-component system response regulator RegX3
VPQSHLKERRSRNDAEGNDTKILLVEDDKLITGPLATRLAASDFQVSVAHNGRDGLAMALAGNPDIVVLDVMLPEMDGWEVCKALRVRSTVPIMMLTALEDEVDRVLGLELGADDYMTKPFSTRELLARLRAMLRRVRLDKADRPVAERLAVGPIVLDLNTRRAFKGGQELTLRFKEFELLSLLMGRVGDTITRAELFDQVWGTDWLGDTRTLDVHVRWLREKIEDDPSHPFFIQTVRSVGYRFTRQEEPS